jgi:hypothetical protein
MNREWIIDEIRAGVPFRAGETRLIPMTRMTRLQLPGLPSHLIWNRPAAVVAHHADGREQILPVRDYTRQAQFTLLGIGLLGSLLLLLTTRRR